MATTEIDPPQHLVKQNKDLKLYKRPVLKLAKQIKEL